GTLHFFQLRLVGFQVGGARLFGRKLIAQGLFFLFRFFQRNKLVLDEIKPAADTQRGKGQNQYKHAPSQRPTADVVDIEAAQVIEIQILQVFQIHGVFSANAAPFSASSCGEVCWVCNENSKCRLRPSSLVSMTSSTGVASQSESSILRM